MNRDEVYTPPVPGSATRVTDPTAHRRDAHEVRCRITPLHDLAPTGTPFLNRRLVQVRTREEGEAGEGTVLVQLWVGGGERDGHERAEAFDRLDNEILAGVRLARYYRGRPHPPEFTRLVGYHDDPLTPFALLTPYQGEPVHSLLTRRGFFDRERTDFQRGLVQALARLQTVGVVHRGLTPGTVCWNPDRGTVQLYDFTLASVAGAARTAVGDQPWASPEQLAAVGRCDPRDDVWSAGHLLFQVLTGREMVHGEPLSGEDFPVAAANLRGMFAAEAEHRSGADRLLERLTGIRSAPPGIDAPLAPHHARFDLMLAQKRGDVPFGKTPFGQAPFGENGEAPVGGAPVDAPANRPGPRPPAKRPPSYPRSGPDPDRPGPRPDPEGDRFGRPVSEPVAPDPAPPSWPQRYGPVLAVSLVLAVVTALALRYLIGG